MLVFVISISRQKAQKKLVFLAFLSTHGVNMFLKSVLCLPVKYFFDSGKIFGKEIFKCTVSSTL